MKMIKSILIICIILLVLLLIFCIWFVRAPAGVRIFPNLAKTPLNKFIEYKWEAGETADDDIQCILNYDADKCILRFSGTGNMINFSNGDTRSWHSLNDMTVGWTVPINTIIIENGITFIGQYTFTNMKLTNVTIPSSIEIISDNAFVNCISRSGDIINVSFEGDKAHWNSIKKSDQWCDKLSKKNIRSIKCSDGEILIENSDSSNY